jgi:hypothetical protein
MLVDTYLKGFKLDDEKIRDYITRHEKVHEQNTGPDWQINWYEPIINCIPRTAYIELGMGFNPNRKIVVVIVLEKGLDKEALEKTPVHTDNETLAQIAKLVLTPGVWPSRSSFTLPAFHFSPSSYLPHTQFTFHIPLAIVALVPAVLCRVTM